MTGERGSATVIRWSTVAMLATALVGAGCERYERLQVQPAGSLQTHYLLDFESSVDARAGERTAGFLVVFNPSSQPADFDVTVYFEDRDPQSFRLTARAGATTAFHATEWPIKPTGRFALEVRAAQPVIAQATLGWDDAAGNGAPDATTTSPRGLREAATSYVAIPGLADRWYLADGIVLNDRRELWYRESEWTFLLNPGDAPAHVDLAVFYSPLTRHHAVDVPPRRLRVVLMDDLVLANHHYGVRVASDRPVAAHSRRAVYWHDSPELMTFWSVPLVPLAAAVAP